MDEPSRRCCGSLRQARIARHPPRHPQRGGSVGTREHGPHYQGTSEAAATRERPSRQSTHIGDSLARPRVDHGAKVRDPPAETDGFRRRPPNTRTPNQHPDRAAPHRAGFDRQTTNSTAGHAPAFFCPRVAPRASHIDLHRARCAVAAWRESSCSPPNPLVPHMSRTTRRRNGRKCPLVDTPAARRGLTNSRARFLATHAPNATPATGARVSGRARRARWGARSAQPRCGRAR
jgi:hypothetical protein